MKQVGWHLEVKQVKVSGKPGYHWCAVDQDGEVLDFYFTPTRDEGTALAFLRRWCCQSYANPSLVDALMLQLTKA